jgi:hypothetical protein
LNIDRAHFGDQGVVLRCRNKDVVGDAGGAVNAVGVDVDVVGELCTDDLRIGLWVARR